MATGDDPAERTWTLPFDRLFVSSAAIWDLPAFCSHTKSTSGTGDSIAPLACPRAVSRSVAKRMVWDAR